MASELFKASNILGSLDINKAVGPDDVSCHMLRGCSKELCFPLTILLTHVCRSGEIPS